jgi:lysozyme family protein
MTAHGADDQADLFCKDVTDIDLRVRTGSVPDDHDPAASGNSQFWAWGAGCLQALQDTLQHRIRDISVPHHVQFTMLQKMESLHGIVP